MAEHDISKMIMKTARSIEYLKVLYRNQSLVGNVKDSMVDEKSVATLEKELSEDKWKLIQSLSEPNTFENWLASDNNQSHLLYKYFAKGHFVPEIALDDMLLKKFQNLEKIFLDAPVESLLVPEEKQRQKHFEQNLVPEEKRYQYAKEDAQVVQVFQKEQSFQKAFDALIHYSVNHPTSQKILQRIKDNPIFLSNHPSHHIVNPGKQELTLSAPQLAQLFSEEHTHVDKIKKLDVTFDNLVAKKPLTHIIQNMRTYSKEISLEISAKKR